ncbi:MAG TPA: hypothetical protein VKU82_03585 [Planctomycetaceae bacterium]|nr:hypothetical protein [Planctomycetaceae bacterium]
MPALSKFEAAERLAQVVEKANSSDLVEIYDELFPERPSSTPPTASDIAEHIRSRLEAEEIVDLWNVVFPEIATSGMTSRMTKFTTTRKSSGTQTQNDSGL